MNLVFDSPPFLIGDDGRCPRIPNLYLRLLARRSPATCRNYAYALKRWLVWCERRGLRWEEAGPEDVLVYLGSLKGSKGWVNWEMARLRRFCEFADGHGVPSPVGRLTRPHNLLKLQGARRPEIRLVSRKDAGRFIRGFDNPRDRLIAEVMYLCGLRLGEVLRMGREFLAASAGSSGVPFDVTGKGGVTRHLVMAPALRDRLAEHARPTAGPLVFSHDGRGLHHDTVEKAFQRNGRRTGIRVHPHLLRHMYATHRLAFLEKALAGGRGVNSALKILQAELGHADIATTSIYLHLADEREASESLRQWQEEEMEDIGDAA